MKLREKISIFVLLAGLLGMLISYAMAHSNSSRTAQKYYSDSLNAVRETKSTQIREYFDRLRNETSMLSQNLLTLEASKDFITAFDEVKNSQSASADAVHFESPIDKLRRIIADRDLSRELVKAKSQLPSPDQSSNSEDKTSAALSRYGEAYEKYHKQLSLIMKKFGYHNIILADAKTGDLVYSVKQEYEFGRSLLDNNDDICNLCKAFVSAKNAYYKDFVRLIDFDFYTSKSKVPASFVSAPIYDGKKLIATIIVHLSFYEFDHMMNGSENWQGEGLGETGETYIVGADFKMRSNSRFFTENKQQYLDFLSEKGVSPETINSMAENNTTVLYQKVETESVKKALLGKSGVEYAEDYRGVKVLSSYSPLHIPDVNWAVVSEIDVDEIYAPLKALQRNTFIQICVLSTLLLFLGSFFSRKLTGPLSQLTVALEQLGEGNFSQKISVESNDEIGTLTKYFNHAASELEAMNNSVNAFRNKSDNLEQEIREVVKLSQYDFLTGAYNRNMISSEINHVLIEGGSRSKINSLLMFDLDNFKYVNDTYGHDRGDQILKIIAELVQDRKRDQDIFARWGGDEFMMLLPATNLRQANFFAEKMRLRIESHPILKRNNITCSFGVTQIDNDKSEEEVFKQVDIALYEAKKSGRNCVKSYDLKAAGE